ncbi:hypothetical protein BAUCODRAFT_320660 [Baudoinia panamericana UAMH 10762]|uniref:CENP-V/GFA domain-containing protein n=1 Tax=Baudoinia panamericana (strain UAMH 10762) TaxID=717646 RepID=M2MYB9_BAUPA|nr:uncharacterized protein BAUCODRAFT_320660 [Baudoinia panamericana UAMH 10762]EMC91285.1 hypothetical protein BAUCODRAFT_320660 [Baudoinia panamericana UAMH 10762]
MSSSKAPKTKVTKSSTCLCGSISFTVTGVDKGTVLCHCSNCQKISGSAFLHNYRFTDSTLNFTKGEDLVVKYVDSDTKSGKVLHRHFCSKCGSTLFILPQAFPGLSILCTGSMQDKTQPSFELFTENKSPWIGDVAAQKAKM